MVPRELTWKCTRCLPLSSWQLALPENVSNGSSQKKSSSRKKTWPSGKKNVSLNVNLPLSSQNQLFLLQNISNRLLRAPARSPHYSAAFQKALLQRPDDLSMQLAFLPQITAKMIFVWFHDDTCRPRIGLQKHYSDSMMANQGLTRGCLGARHLAKSKLPNDSQNGGLQMYLIIYIILS